MPESYDKPHPYRKPYSLGNAARDGMLLVVKCNCCRRTTHYLATDLIELLGQDRAALDAPFECSRCGTREYMRVSLRSPEGGDYGHLLVRRPAGVVLIQKWRTVKLGDEAKAPPRSRSRFEQYLDEQGPEEPR